MEQQVALTLWSLSISTYWTVGHPFGVSNSVVCPVTKLH